MQYRLASKRLYIADLARRLHELENRRVALQPLAYRVVAKRLREALAGLPEPMLAQGFAELPTALLPLVDQMRETRHFEHHGRLFGPGADACRDAADRLFARLMQPE
jgi:hypothetical protein